MNSDTFTDRLKLSVGDESVRAFASRAGMSDTVVRQYLSGKSDPSRSAVIAIAGAARVNLAWLATGEGPMKPVEEAVAAASGGLDLDEYALVPRYNVEVSAGGGALVDGETVIDTMAFKQEWLRRMGFEVAKLVLVTAKGDSMVPTIYDGDLLLVDLRQVEIVDGGVHVLRNDGHLLAKRLQVGMGDQVIVRSDNSIYSAFDTKRDQLNVVGRVVWRGGRM